MLRLIREESDGTWTVLARDHHVLPLTLAVTDEYEREQRLEIVHEDQRLSPSPSGDAPLATWQPELGWMVTTFAGDQDLLQAHLNVHEFTERLYFAVDDLSPLALDLVYLLAALAKGGMVEWEVAEALMYDPDDDDNFRVLSKLCRLTFHDGHQLWKHVSWVPLP
jgi:hypothetical protein